jgi:hypothetical protein
MGITHPGMFQRWRKDDFAKQRDVSVHDTPDGTVIWSVFWCKTGNVNRWTIMGSWGRFRITALCSSDGKRGASISDITDEQMVELRLRELL